MSIGIIIFDGPDGVGKTTLINHIKKMYNNSYLNDPIGVVLFSQEPIVEIE